MIKEMQYFLFALLMIQTQCLTLSATGQENPYSALNVSNSDWLYNHSIAISERGNAYQFMSLRRYLGVNNALVKKGSRDAINHQWILIENLMKTAQISQEIKNNKSPFKDKYKTWITLSETSVHHQEVFLYEGYAFFYIAQFLFYTRENGWSTASSENGKRWRAALLFLETNIWTKWSNRSLKKYGKRFRIFLWTRTHMGAHWAGVAMYLKKITQNSAIRQDCMRYLQQYDTLLRRNLVIKGNGYIWNSTYDDVTGTDAGVSEERVIQDVSHGNHVISYIVAAFEGGDSTWTLKDLSRLAYTFSKFVYNKHDDTFNDNVDGTQIKDGNGHGDFVGDGWVKLAKYDSVVAVLMKNILMSKSIYKYNQEVQIRANLY